MVGMTDYALASALAFVNTPLSTILLASVPLLYILPPIIRTWREYLGFPSERAAAG